MSGGEVQRVTLALAVGIPGPEILLLDGMPSYSLHTAHTYAFVEPTSALDEETSEMIEKYLLGLLHSQATLKAVVWITHSKDQEHRVATRHLVMETGGTITPNNHV